ncbi:MAG TPA: hypothetical protein VGO67_20425 [Verrucomicrobiae bacterium]|jgi:hypothetical protein
MKKRVISSFVLTALLCLGATGCSNKNIDTAKIRAAFPNLEGDAKVQLEKGLAACDANDYAGAVKPLEKATYEIKMNKDQREILQDALKKARAKSPK